MGNCLVLQEKVIMMKKMDDQVPEYQEPLKSHHGLSKFGRYAISDTLPDVRHRRPDTKISGGMYYLLPSPLPSTEIDKRITILSNPVTEGVVRIKVVITKRELHEMLTKGGVSVDDMISHLENRKSKAGLDDCDGDDNGSFKGWRPVLESIPEVN
ncbi:hypothetical protein HHK36_033105 [Tetracentron sinense]|uniref:Uncharacterized protein n=1 Tax=Tetracentron sinense TaxID=13715 RepID=A0A834Y859_TETSI|nr:hypothetical protein HHK36_033105 [Tetracentron sinense]